MEIAFSGNSFFFIGAKTNHGETDILHLGTKYTVDASVDEVNFVCDNIKYPFGNSVWCNPRGPDSR